MTSCNCVQHVFVQKRITATFKLQNIYSSGCKLSMSYYMWKGDWLKIQHPSFLQPSEFSYPFELTPSAAVHSTNPVCSLVNNTICGTVWRTDGRLLLSVVLWLWLSAVLYYRWMVISLITLHWNEAGQSHHLSQLTAGKVWNVGNLGYPPDSADHGDKGHALTSTCVFWFTTPPRISLRQFSAC